MFFGRHLRRGPEEDYRTCFRQITALFPEAYRVNELKKLPKRQMILNLSLLAPKRGVPESGVVLAGFQGEGVEVRFTGPWPPYSFVHSHSGRIGSLGPGPRLAAGLDPASPAGVADRSSSLTCRGCAASMSSAV